MLGWHRDVGDCKSTSMKAARLLLIAQCAQGHISGNLDSTELLSLIEVSVGKQLAYYGP